MKEKEKKEPKKPDPLKMKASEFDEIMRHALGVPPLADEPKKGKKKAPKKG